MSSPRDGDKEDPTKDDCKMDRDSSDGAVDDEAAMCSENDSVTNGSQSATAGPETHTGSGTDTCDEEVASLGLPPIPVPGTSEDLNRMGYSERDMHSSEVNGSRNNLTDNGNASDEANGHATKDTKKLQRRRRKRTVTEDDSEDECHEAAAQSHLGFVPIVKASSEEDSSTNGEIRVTPVEGGDFELRKKNGANRCSSDHSMDEAARETANEDDSPEQLQDQEMAELPMEESVQAESALGNLGKVHDDSKLKNPNSPEPASDLGAENQRELPRKRKLSPISEESDFNEREVKKVRSSESDSENSQEPSSISE